MAGPEHLETAYLCLISEVYDRSNWSLTANALLALGKRQAITCYALIVDMIDWLLDIMRSRMDLLCGGHMYLWVHPYYA